MNQEVREILLPYFLKAMIPHGYVDIKEFENLQDRCVKDIDKLWDLLLSELKKNL